jgi:hypothetical protein
MNPLKNLTHLVLFLLIIGVSGGTFSCKSKKKLAAEEAAAAEARKIAKAKADLEELLSSSNTMSLEEKEQKLQYIKDLNIDDPEVKELIVQVDDKLKREREALLAKENAERMAREREERLKAEGSKERMTLNDYFNGIAGADNLTSANMMIDEALQLFASDNVPVLIIISQAGGENDYDRPTTIRKYLEYCKDQKVSRNEVENVVYDSNGKITELELIKK